MSNKLTVLIPEGTNSATIVSRSIIGPQGAGVLSGIGAPADALGNQGDFYYDTANFIFYGPKTNVWSAGISLGVPLDNTDTTFTYDINGSLIRIDKASGAFLDFTYDTNGDLLSTANGIVTKTFIYDTNGNVVQILVS